MIDLSDSKLMFIEPEGPGIEIQDNLAEVAAAVLQACKDPGTRWRGTHGCSCGERSDNRDYITPCGRTTNSLLVHYIVFHRSEIPDSELNKLKEEWEYIVGPDALPC